MSTLRQSIDRLRAWQLVVLAGLLAGIPFIAVFLAAMATINTYLVPENQLRTETVSRLVEADFDRALGLGIPLDKLVGVMPYLEEIIRQNRGLEFVAIADSSRKVLYGMGVEGRRRLLHPIAEGTPAAALGAGRGQDVILVSTPLGSGGRGAGGTLLVGADAVPPQSVYASLQLKLLVGFFIAFFGCYELLAYCAGRAVAVPARAADALIDRLDDGDLRHTERVSSEGRLSGVLITLNRIVRVLNDRVAEFRIYAEEVRQSTLDPVVKDRIGALARQVEAGLRLPERAPMPRPEQENRPLDRLVLFLLAASAAALLPGLSYRPEASATARLLPLAGCFAGLILGGRALRPLFRGVGRAVPALFALVLAGLSAVATTLPAPGVPGVFAMQLVLGGAIGLLAAYHAGLERPAGSPRTALAEMPGAALLSGGICGIGLADLLARFDAGDGVLPAALCLFALAAISSWLGAPRGRQGTARIGWPSPNEIAAGFGRWRIGLTAFGLIALPRALAALLLVMLPGLPAPADAEDLTAVLLPALLLAAFAYYPALTLAHAFPGTIRPLAVLSRLAMAGGTLLAGLEPSPLAEIGFYVAAGAFGAILPIDDLVALQAGRRDVEIGPRRALLLSHLATGLAVPAGLAAAAFMPEGQSLRLAAGLAGALLLAALIQAGLGLRVPKRAGKLPEAGL